MYKNGTSVNFVFKFVDEGNMCVVYIRENQKDGIV